MSEPNAPAPPPPRELVPLIGVWAALAVLSAGFGWMLLQAHRERPVGLDQSALNWVVEHRGDFPAMTSAAHAVTALGNDDVAYPTVIGLTLLLVALARLDRPRVGPGEWVFFLTVTLAGTASGTLVKLLVGRARPDPTHRLVVVTNASFPSGHSLYAAVVMGMVALLLLFVIRHVPGPVRWISALGCVILALGVAGSRIWLGVHYPTDVAGGLCLGLAWVAAAWALRLHRRTTPGESR